MDFFVRIVTTIPWPQIDKNNIVFLTNRFLVTDCYSSVFVIGPMSIYFVQNVAQGQWQMRISPSSESRTLPGREVHASHIATNSSVHFIYYQTESILGLRFFIIIFKIKINTFYFDQNLCALHLLTS